MQQNVVGRGSAPGPLCQGRVGPPEGRSVLPRPVWQLRNCRPSAKYCSAQCCTVTLHHLLLQCDDRSAIEANIEIGYGKIQKLAIMVVH